MSPSVILLNLVTGERLPCPLPSDTPLRFVTALGNFDGVHMAHRELLARTVTLANERSTYGISTAAAAFCFTAPSGDYFSDQLPQHLTTQEEKLSLFAACGLSYAFLADFPSLRDHTPEQFIKETLVSACATDAVVCGYNFRFGQRGMGDCKTLAGYFGKSCSVLPRIEAEVNGRRATVSSSAVRALLLAGDCAAAAQMLCRPYSFTAPVVHGKKLARSLGLPTANQFFPPKKLIPGHGVYATLCRIDGRAYFGVSNVGHRPTVDGEGTQINCETHILHFEGDLYGKEITVYFCQRLRGEMRFESVDALKAAILSDIERAEKYFASPTATTLLSSLPNR